MPDSQDTSVVFSIVKSLDTYLVGKDFDVLFTMGSKLSFVAYSLHEHKDKSLLQILPSLIKFTEIIHRISESSRLKIEFDEIIVAFLHDLKAWLVHYFLEPKPELIASNVLASLSSSVDSIEVLLGENSDVGDLDDIFF